MLGAKLKIGEDYLDQASGVAKTSFMSENTPSPFSNPEGQLRVPELQPEGYDEMMQVRLAMRDSEHLNLIAILHYVWAGLVGLGAVFCIGYMFMMGAVMETAMKSVPATVTTPASSAPASPASSEGSASTPAPPVSPGGSFSVSPASSSTATTHSTSGATTVMMDTVMMWMCVFYGVLAALFVIGCVCNVLSARWMQKRKHRVFSMVVGAINVVMIPLGTVLGIFTFIVLCRQSVAQMLMARS